MSNKLILDLASTPLTHCDIDELENIARTHENLAYRYRSAISLMRLRLKQDAEKDVVSVQSAID